jgi:hypothetical protein
MRPTTIRTRWAANTPLSLLNRRRNSVANGHTVTLGLAFNLGELFSNLAISDSKHIDAAHVAGLAIAAHSGVAPAHNAAVIRCQDVFGVESGTWRSSEELLSERSHGCLSLVTRSRSGDGLVFSDTSPRRDYFINIVPVERFIELLNFFNRRDLDCWMRALSVLLLAYTLLGARPTPADRCCAWKSFGRTSAWAS